jgi:uncharacterized membrane protein YdjX (TVP38/TMEM64 family)
MNANNRNFEWKKLATLLITISLLMTAYFLGPQNLFPSSLNLIASLGAWGGLLFILLYIFATVLCIPGSILTLSAGVLFGVVHGSLLVSAGSTLGATAAFLTGRYITQKWVLKKIQVNGQFQTIDQAVSAKGWKIVILTRLTPALPFNFLNYAFGLTKISLPTYMFASWLGMIPATVMYVYIGSLSRDIATLETSQQPLTSTEWIFNFFGLGVTIALALYIARIAQQILGQKCNE